MIVGAAQESESVGQDFERALAEHQAVHLRPLFEDAEDEVLLLEPGVFADLLLAGEIDEFLHRHPLEFGDVDVAPFDLFVPCVGRIDDLVKIFAAVFGEAAVVLAERSADEIEFVVVRLPRGCRSRFEGLGHDVRLEKGTRSPAALRETIYESATSVCLIQLRSCRPADSIEPELSTIRSAAARFSSRLSWLASRFRCCSADQPRAAATRS